MRILHFGRFFTDYRGGLENVVASYLRHMPAEHHVDNLVANLAWRSDRISYAGRDVYRVGSAGVFASTALAPLMPIRARRLHRRNHYDIAHLHLPDPLSIVCALTLPASIRLVIYWHSDVIRQKQLLRLYQPLVNRVLRRAGAVIAATPAHFSSSTQLDAAGEEKRFVVPYGFDFSKYDPPDEATRRRAGEIRSSAGADAPGRRGLIFALGRHVYYKGFLGLLEAMTRVPDAVLILGGAGPLSDTLRERASRPDLAGRVILPGKIPDEEIPAYYHACDVFTMPSVEPAEAFGLVQLDAMACRRPVVACDLKNGVSYVNQHEVTGLLTPPRDPEALAAALNRLLDNPPLREKLGAAGHKRAHGEYSMSRMIESTLEVYRRVIAAGTSNI